MEGNINGILESALYFPDLNSASEFYKDLFGFEVLLSSERLVALSVAGKQVLLLFQEEGSLKEVQLPTGGFIPAHDGKGPVHIAFSIDSGSIGYWKERLTSRNIDIESEISFNQGYSLYFYDTNKHLVELATPGIWKGLGETL
ncbi:VOC family protein [Dyadobacter chenwenxiniae]|uniref:VOC family protein n=1 Tax=Dyadobacter chenwenxiniae TaxID=2906456 RepID=A0A9X1PLU1_9BACT|nr:VOC family protein [Dyadobacter chenwenxiniae]MCF0063196.1 VOC family protein [Dyadobacter chenwenxiniae]UON85424.1 VOC family protein [Dyadobacter chenwenxiniae]